MRLIPGYDRAWLPADVAAGLTVWALMVPQALAYAGIAGVPVQNGLYVLPLSVVGYLLLGSSRHLYVGPSAAVATLSASTVAVVAGASTGSAEYIALTVALTLMIGVIYIAGGLMPEHGRVHSRCVPEEGPVLADPRLSLPCCCALGH